MGRLQESKSFLSVTQTRFEADLGKGTSALPAGVSRLLLTKGNASVRSVSSNAVPLERGNPFFFQFFKRKRALSSLHPEHRL